MFTQNDNLPKKKEKKKSKKNLSKYYLKKTSKGS